MRASFVAVLGVALLSSACSNLVYSARPLFDGQPTADLRFRPGLWAAPAKGCRFNAVRPLSAWPKCANGAVFDAAGPVGDPVVNEKPAVFESGGAVIIQSENEKRDPPDRPDAASLPYSYLAIGRLNRDAGGRITRFSEWLVQCGPPHLTRKPRKADGPAQSDVTRHPFPGLTVLGDNCEATDAASVRHAATASRAFGATGARWVRDGSR
jgi:hypothetical protein